MGHPAEDDVLVFTSASCYKNYINPRFLGRSSDKFVHQFGEISTCT